MDNIKKLDKLTIKCFHMNKVEFLNRTYIEDKTLYLREDLYRQEFNKDFIKNVKVKIINPLERKVLVNSIMDFYPIATKVLGKIGEGITHTLTGTIVMLTGADEKGVQAAEFGSSEGILSEQVVFNRAGTPSDKDIIIHIDVILKENMTAQRKAITEVHRLSDLITNEIRNYIKMLNPRLYDERHEYYNEVNPKGKKVLIVKQVAGQGAMYDTTVFPKEPCGVIDGKSIIDMGNIPIVLTPNEYRDGAIRAMH